MKLNEILLETPKPRTKSMNYKAAEKFIKENCSEILGVYKKSQVRLWRGVRSDGEYLFGDSTKRIRKSRNTDNYYTIIMDNSSDWKEYPKRSRSFICTSDSDRSTSYGTRYLVFPIDGTKIAVCPQSDIWFGWQKALGGHLNSFIGDLNMLASLYDVRLHSGSNFVEFKKGIDYLGELINKNEQILKRASKYDFTTGESYKRNIIKNSKNLYAYFEKLLKPVDFKIETTSNYDVDGRHECWFSGEAIFVHWNPAVDVKMKRGEKAIDAFIRGL